MESGEERRGFVHNMKSESKSAGKRAIVFLCLLLGGCADTPWPSWLTGEPDDAVLYAPRAVTRPSDTQEKPWPLLGEIPADKPEFSKTADLIEKAEEMQSDKLKAQVETERLRNIQMPKPLGEERENPLPYEEKPSPAFGATPQPFSALLPRGRE